MSQDSDAILAFVEAAAGQGDNPEIDAAGAFQHGDWVVRVLDWTRKGGTITVTRADAAFQCTAGGLDDLGEFASRVMAPGDWSWPTPGQWPAKYRWTPETNEFVVDSPKELVAVANTPRKAKKGRRGWCDEHSANYHGTCPSCGPEDE